MTTEYGVWIYHHNSPQCDIWAAANFHNAIGEPGTNWFYHPIDGRFATYDINVAYKCLEDWNNRSCIRSGYGYQVRERT